VVLLALALSACGDGNCSEQSCSKFGGSASKTLLSCYSSGSGSSPDDFVLKDASGQQFYACSRPANDNTACGVELLSAKESYCAKP
jgi:hypothetical protein